MEIMKPELDGESPCHSENELIGVKQDEDPATRPSSMKTEHEVSCMSACTLKYLWPFVLYLC
jgi:hypothetical protein